MATSLEPTTGYDYQTYSDPFCEFQDMAYAKDFIVTIYCLVFIVGAFGNVIVIIIMRSKRKSNRLVDVFITHLAIADLVFLLTLPLWAVSTALDHHWLFGGGLCKMCSYIVVVNMYSSIFFLTCMSIDRYVAIVLSMNYGYLRSRRYAIIASLVIWIISFALGLPTLSFRYMVLVDYNDKWICSELNTPSNHIFTLITRFIAFVLPLGIITMCYSSVGIKLYRHSDRMRKEERQKRKSIKIGFWIITLFVLSWLPYNILKTMDVLVQSSTIQASCDTQEAVSKGIMLFTCLAFMNSCANPIVYLVFDCYFRASFFQLLPCQAARRLNVHSSTSLPNSTRSQRHNSSFYKDKKTFSLAKISSKSRSMC
ncbi:apelin receptor A-like [Carcharodon carcharias]|uniref:apelin receptor A-like n=1 Tax=Carcharodon carcharias TaxID=13397 RepID=UPI001B7D9F15|nr:apelin receptor A-like [Carcharodon carcharias]